MTISRMLRRRKRMQSKEKTRMRTRIRCLRGAMQRKKWTIEKRNTIVRRISIEVMKKNSKRMKMLMVM